MKTYSVRLTRQAREHLHGIRRYIDDELLAPEAARNTVAHLKDAVLGLDRMPARSEAGTKTPPSFPERRRCLMYGP